MAPYTRQKAFDIATRGLLTQNSKSMGRKYRDSRGRKCAVGFLIPDTLYDPSIEGEPIKAIIHENNLPLAKLFAIEDMEFYAKLQKIHDRNYPISWKRLLSVLAREYKLDTSVLKEFD